MFTSYIMKLKDKFTKTPSYQINLDISPSKRWLPLMEVHKQVLKETVPKFEKLINSMFANTVYLAILTIKAMRATGQIMYVDEIDSIAKFIGMSFEHVLLLQICYELNSCCTSAITKSNGDYVFFRTMDWPMSWLNKLTVDLEFIQNGKILYKATSWVGYVGIATATVPNKYSIAMNFRLTKERTMTNILGNISLLVGLKWPVGYLIRQVCENNYDYDTMIVILCSSDIVSPCYLTICGVDEKPNIITRDPSAYKITRGEYAVQTNCDQCKVKPDILYSVSRRSIVTDAILKKNNSWESVDEITNDFLVNPVVNDETIYYSIMIPKNGEHYSYTYFPHKK